MDASWRELNIIWYPVWVFFNWSRRFSLIILKWSILSLQFNFIYFILTAAVVKLFLLWTKNEIFRLPKNLLTCGSHTERSFIFLTVWKHDAGCTAFVDFIFWQHTQNPKLSNVQRKKTSKFFIDFRSCLPIWMRTHLGEILALKSLRVLVQWLLNIPCM